MAVEAFTSLQLAADFRGRPINNHGKMRQLQFEFATATVAGDINSTFDIGYLPPGAVRLVPNMCFVQVSAWGASRLLDVGHRAYSVSAGIADQVEDLDAFAASIDVAAAGVKPFIPAAIKYDLYSRAGILVSAQVRGGTIPIGGTLSGYLTYLYE